VVRRKLVNRIAVTGRLALPGSAWPNAPITVLLPRLGAPPLAKTVIVKEGYFWTRFEGPARTALSFGAAIGRSFEVDVLGRVTGLGLAELLGTLELLERHGVLRAAGSSGYDFAHDLVRRAAYRQMSEPRRRLVHAQIARVLAALPDPDGARAGDVAHHAGLGGDQALAAEACLRAAEQCLPRSGRCDPEAG